MLKTHAAVRTLGVCAKGARSFAPLEACTEDAERAGFFAKLFLQKKRGKAGKGMNMERIDKVLALHGFGSRKEVAALDVYKRQASRGGGESSRIRARSSRVLSMNMRAILISGAAGRSFSFSTARAPRSAGRALPPISSLRAAEHRSL